MVQKNSTSSVGLSQPHVDIRMIKFKLVAGLVILAVIQPFAQAVQSSHGEEVPRKNSSTILLDNGELYRHKDFYGAAEQLKQHTPDPEVLDFLQDTEETQEVDPRKEDRDEERLPAHHSSIRSIEKLGQSDAEAEEAQKASVITEEKNQEKRGYTEKALEKLKEVRLVQAQADKDIEEVAEARRMIANGTEIRKLIKQYKEINKSNKEIPEKDRQTVSSTTKDASSTSSSEPQQGNTSVPSESHPEHEDQNKGINRKESSRSIAYSTVELKHKQEDGVTAQGNKQPDENYVDTEKVLESINAGPPLQEDEATDGGDDSYDSYSEELYDTYFRNGPNIDPREVEGDSDFNQEEGKINDQGLPVTREYKNDLPEAQTDVTLGAPQYEIEHPQSFSRIHPVYAKGDMTPSGIEIHLPKYDVSSLVNMELGGVDNTIQQDFSNVRDASMQHQNLAFSSSKGSAYQESLLSLQDSLPSIDAYPTQKGLSSLNINPGMASQVATLNPLTKAATTPMLPKSSESPASFAESCSTAAAGSNSLTNFLFGKSSSGRSPEDWEGGNKGSFFNYAYPQNNDYPWACACDRSDLLAFKNKEQSFVRCKNQIDQSWENIQSNCDYTNFVGSADWKSALVLLFAGITLVFVLGG